MHRIVTLLFALMLANHSLAAPIEPRDGWAVHPTQHAYSRLIDKLKQAIPTEGMAIVTQAGPTGAARNRGINIPGNRVVGVFNNDFAVRILQISTPAMIEAPIRFYITENPDGSATLSYKTPSHVFSPYLEGADGDLSSLATELDKIFAAIAARAIER